MNFLFYSRFKLCKNHILLLSLFDDATSYIKHPLIKNTPIYIKIYINICTRYFDAQKFYFHLGNLHQNEV